MSRTKVVRDNKTNDIWTYFDGKKIYIQKIINKYVPENEKKTVMGGGEKVVILMTSQ